MDSVYFGDLTTRELDAIAGGDRIPVLLQPVGAVEPHGLHVGARRYAAGEETFRTLAAILEEAIREVAC